ncbi:hypothetical protein BpHYR1_031063 [Brachionus plicatilis]|uniref:Uncharacterized protein n=1 Tax=Brachionus plicatilis TaxID=10195 RepID=A0A3M7RXT9_BRAPC|nr:hypothetical protein BpHYR1_031063 [Brachionus plicatilis]
MLLTKFLSNQFLLTFNIIVLAASIHLIISDQPLSPSSVGLIGHIFLLAFISFLTFSNILMLFMVRGFLPAEKDFTILFSKYDEVTINSAVSIKLNLKDFFTKSLLKKMLQCIRSFLNEPDSLSMA